jgi:protein CpxP
MKLHKLSLIAVLALGSLLVCTNFSSAQDATKEGKKRGGFSPQQRVERLATELTLNAEQKTKLTTVFEDETKKMRDLRADTAVPRDQQREKVRALREESNKQIKTILTNEQWEKYQKLRDDMRQKAADKKAENKN